MQITRAFAYAVSEYFCVIMLLLLLRSSSQIKRHNRQQYWFNTSLTIQAAYLLGDGTRTLWMNHLLPGNDFLINFASLYLAITLNILSYTTLMFVAYKIELPLATSKRQNRIALGLPIVISFIDVICALFAPELIFSSNDINAFTPFFSGLFLFLPISYSAFVFGVTAYNALINRKNGLGHYYLVLTFYPALMTVFGFIEVMLSTALPLYSYAVTFYFTFNFLYQLNSSIREATIDSLTGLRNRENLREFIDDIWKQGINDQYYLFMIDMNGLKSVNDVYGHVEGDHAIRAIGQALDDVLQTGNDGIVCRYGGDEFLAVITVTDDNQADKLVQLTRERIEYYSKVDQLQSAPKVATGYIHLPKEKIPLADLLKQADSKMYAEKQAMKTGDRAANFFTDEITGLPNANYFHNFAGNFLKKQFKEGKQPLVILFNISGMHSYNDRFGYQGGDDLLRMVSRVLREFFDQENSVLVRYTEDNFVLVTCESLSTVKQKVKAVSEKVTAIDSIGIKAGIYQIRGQKEDVIATVDMARRAMRLIGS
ncbi:diguanylate cyclase domain-containing protein, partial [Lactobacillus nasalidis]